MLPALNLGGDVVSKSLQQLEFKGRFSCLHHPAHQGARRPCRRLKQMLQLSA